MGFSRPTLEVIASGADVVISWPFWAANYALETSTSLGPSAQWTAYTNGVALSGNKFVTTNTPAGAAFFRLSLL